MLNLAQDFSPDVATINLLTYPSSIIYISFMSAAKKIATIAAPVKAALVARAKLFEAKSYEKPGLTAEQVVEVKQAFDLFDTDGTGSIDTKGTSATMKSSRQQWSRWDSTLRTPLCSR